MNGQPTLSERFPGGCYIGFNAVIDRKAAEQLVSVCSDAARNGFSELRLCLSSPGGLLDHTHYAFNMLEALAMKITTYNIGNVQSAANLLFLCGEERYAATGATFFFHKTAAEPPNVRVTETYLAERIKSVRYDDARMAELISRKTGQPLKAVHKWLDRELVVTTDDAIKVGIISAVRDLRIPADAFFHQVIV